MSKLRHGILPSEGAVEEHVQRCRRQPLFAANNMSNLHEVIVHDIRQMIRRQFVSRLIKHLIVEDIRLYSNVATDEVVNDNFLSRFDEEAHHILFALREQFFHLFSGQRQ